MTTLLSKLKEYIKLFLKTYTSHILCEDRAREVRMKMKDPRAYYTDWP